MRFVDWIHATLSVLVFGAVALRDKYVTDCFYPSPKKESTKHVLDIVPVGIGFYLRDVTELDLVTGNVDRR
ncbi:unnamed protein product [Brassica oleracea var. botrytis]